MWKAFARVLALSLRQKKSTRENTNVFIINIHTGYWKQQAESNKQWFVDDEQYKLKTWLFTPVRNGMDFS